MIQKDFKIQRLFHPVTESGGDAYVAELSSQRKASLERRDQIDQAKRNINAELGLVIGIREETQKVLQSFGALGQASNKYSSGNGTFEEGDIRKNLNSFEAALKKLDDRVTNFLNETELGKQLISDNCLTGNLERNVKDKKWKLSEGLNGDKLEYNIRIGEESNVGDRVTADLIISKNVIKLFDWLTHLEAVTGEVDGFPFKYTIR